MAAGGALLHATASQAKVLVMRSRARVFELPKGHVEAGESLTQAAARELCEETGLRRAPAPTANLGAVTYHFDGHPPVHKRVHFFLFVIDGAAPALGPRPQGIRELRWVRQEEIDALPLTSENLRPVLRSAFERYRAPKP